jgi:hypothetical protein
MSIRGVPKVIGRRATDKPSTLGENFGHDPIAELIIRQPRRGTAQGYPAKLASISAERRNREGYPLMKSVQSRRKTKIIGYPFRCIRPIEMPQNYEDFIRPDVALQFLIKDAIKLSGIGIGGGAVEH